MTNYPLTLALMGWIVTVDGALWSIAEVAMDGSVFLRREYDEPGMYRAVYTSNNLSDYEMLEFSGAALQRWFPGHILDEHIRNKWDSWRK
jgi:hypothetical protein